MPKGNLQTVAVRDIIFKQKFSCMTPESMKITHITPKQKNYKIYPTDQTYKFYPTDQSCNT